MSGTIQKTGLEGIQRGLSNIAEKADRITKAFIKEDYEPTSDIIGMKLDEHQVKASAKVIKVGDELEKSILDILA